METTRKILLGESTYFIRQLVRRNLEKLGGIEVVDVFDTAEFGSKLGVGGWDLVVLNLAIHGRDGLEVLEELRKDHPNLPIILLSANSAKLGQALGFGASAAFAVPIDFEQLGKKVTEILDL